MAKITWYEKYIGYCFNDNGRDAILEDIFYFENSTGKSKRTGYQVYYPKEDKRTMMDYVTFKGIVNQTVLPK